MKKRWITMGTTLVMTAALAMPALAAGTFQEEKAKLRPDFTIVIDGKEKNFKRSDGSAAYALVYEDATYLPLRAIGEALGKNVNWNEKTKTITLEGERTAKDSSNKYIKGETKTVWVQVRDDFTIVIDGKEKTFRTFAGKEIYPLLYDGSTYLPLRAIGQIMDKEVEWDKDNKTVTLTSAGYTVTDADSFGDKDKETVTDKDNNKNNNKKDDKDKYFDKEYDAGFFYGWDWVKNIALKHADLKEKDVTFVELKVDYDGGKKVYKVEFTCGNVEYEYEIDAGTGWILDFDKDVDDDWDDDDDYITAKEAKKIALKDAGLKESQVKNLEVEKDKDDGVVIYEVEFEKGSTEYEYKINAKTGKILEVDIDD